MTGCFYLGYRRMYGRLKVLCFKSLKGFRKKFKTASGFWVVEWFSGLRVLQISGWGDAFRRQYASV